MKKVLSVVLVAIMMLSMSVGIFAKSYSSETDEETLREIYADKLNSAIDTQLYCNYSKIPLTEEGMVDYICKLMPNSPEGEEAFRENIAKTCIAQRMIDYAFYFMAQYNREVKEELLDSYLENGIEILWNATEHTAKFGRKAVEAAKYLSYTDFEFDAAEYDSETFEYTEDCTDVELYDINYFKQTVKGWNKLAIATYAATQVNCKALISEEDLDTLIMKAFGNAWVSHNSKACPCNEEGFESEVGTEITDALEAIENIYDFIASIIDQIIDKPVYTAN